MQQRVVIRWRASPLPLPACRGGFSANLFPGQLDALLFGITAAGAEILDPEWQANIAGNWYLIMALFFIYLPVIWIVTDRFVEPRLGPWTGGAVAGSDEAIFRAAD